MSFFPAARVFVAGLVLAWAGVATTYLSVTAPPSVVALPSSPAGATEEALPIPPAGGPSGAADLGTLVPDAEGQNFRLMDPPVIETDG